jgi:hypothetical protein
MKTILHHRDNGTAIQIVSHELIIRSEQEILDLMANSDPGARWKKLIVQQSQISPEFFELKTGLAGAILQKISTYGYRLAIIGDFSIYESESLQAFIRESNRTGQVVFVADLETAIQRLCA